MKLLYLTSFFISFVWADFILKYQLAPKMIETIYYKDQNNSKIEIVDHNNKIIQLVYKSKKYLIFKENNITKIIKIDYFFNNSSKENKEETISYDLLKEIGKTKVAGFEATKFLVKINTKDGSYIVDMDLTQEKKIQEALKKSMEIMEKFTPPSQRYKARIFEITPKWSLLKMDNMYLLKFIETNLSKEIFLPPDKRIKISSKKRPKKQKMELTQTKDKKEKIFSNKNKKNLDSDRYQIKALENLLGL